MGWNRSHFKKDFIENNSLDSDEEYFLLEVDVQYPQKLHDLHHDLLFYLKNENWS